MNLPLNKIICGDALEVLKMLPSNSIHLAITSPPYNLDMPYKNHNDNLPYDEYLKWMAEVWKETKRVLISGGRICINIGENKRQNITYPTYSAFIQQLINIGMLYRGTIIWNKNSAIKHTAWGSWNSPSNPHVVPRHEYIIVFSKDKWKLDGDLKKSDMTPEEFMKYTKTVWEFAPETHSKVGHPAPFPEELPYRLIKFYSYKNNIVLDMFSGSGTVGVVAKRLGRNFILIDNCMDYCKIALNRIKKEVSQKKLTDDNLNNNEKIEILQQEELKQKIKNLSIQI